MPENAACLPSLSKSFCFSIDDNSLMFPGYGSMANKRRICYAVAMDEGRKRVIGITAAILASLHMQTADDLFGGPQGVNSIRLMSGIR
jgi:hypothetical protein